MFNKPLIATDFGNQTELLYSLAETLFSKEKPVLTLLTVIEHEEFMPNAMRVQPGLSTTVPVQPYVYVEGDDVEEEIQQRLDEATQYFKSKSFEIKPLLMYGIASECILDTANQYDCDCILIGSHGYRRILDVLVGTTADNVLKYSKIPVILAYKGNPVPKRRSFFEM